MIYQYYLCNRYDNPFFLIIYQNNNNLIYQAAVLNNKFKIALRFEKTLIFTFSCIFIIFAFF